MHASDACHPSDASAQAYTRWYLAEGATGLAAGFVEHILIANPGSVDTRVRITFLTGTERAPSPVPAPTVVAISPIRALNSGGTTVTIAGTNFTNTPTTVTLGGVPATDVMVVNATTITAKSGPFATTSEHAVDVVVTNGGTTRTLPASFTYSVPGLCPLCRPFF